MQATIFNPALQLMGDPSGLWLNDGETGFSFRVNGTGLVDSLGIKPFGSRTIRDAGTLLPVGTAVDFEAQFLRKQGDPPAIQIGSNPKTETSDRNDNTGYTGVAGGARRRFVSVPLARELRGIHDGLPACHSFAIDQERRPVGHVLAQPFTYNSYYGRAADGWIHDHTDADGWCIFNVAHLEETQIHAGAILGDETCLAHHLMLTIAVANYFPGAGKHPIQKGWRGGGQPRAIGEVIRHYARAARLGIGMGPGCAQFRDTYLAGADPKQHLVGLLNDLINNPPPFAINVDPRMIGVIGLYNGRQEVAAWFSWQEAIMAFGLYYATQDTLVGEPLRSQIRDFAAGRVAEIARRAIGPTGKVAQAISQYEDFTQAEVDKANAAGTAGNQSELFNGTIRNVPEVSESETTACVLKLFGHDAEAKLVAANLPGPSDHTRQRDYATVATYLESAYALWEKETTP